MLMLLAPFSTCEKSCGLLGWEEILTFLRLAHKPRRCKKPMVFDHVTIHADWNKTWKTEGKRHGLKEFDSVSHDKTQFSWIKGFHIVKLSISIRFWEQLEFDWKDAEVTPNYLGAQLLDKAWSQTTEPGGRTLANSAFGPLKCFENLRPRLLFFRGLQMCKSWQINSRPW